MIHAQILELRSQVGSLAESHEVLKDPVYLFMWLKHANFKTDQAVKLIKDSYKWRQEIKLHSMDEPEPPHTLKVNIDEFAKDGSNVAFIDLSKVDLRKEISKYGVDHINKVFAYRFAIAEKLLMETNRKRFSNLSDLDHMKAQFRSTIIVCNVESAGMGEVSSMSVLKVAVDAVTALTKHFPCISSHIVFIKAKKFFKIMFNVLEPILRSTMQLQMYDSDSGNKWSLQFDSILDKSQIPDSFGGTKTIAYDYSAWASKQKGQRTKA